MEKEKKKKEKENEEEEEAAQPRAKEKKGTNGRAITTSRNAQAELVQGLRPGQAVSRQTRRPRGARREGGGTARAVAVAGRAG